MKVKNIFTRKISSIGTLQYPRIIKYNICEELRFKTKIYGITILEIKNGEKIEDSFQSISSSYNIVLDILKILYENSVGILTFKDIIEDLLNA